MFVYPYWRRLWFWYVPDISDLTTNQTNGFVKNGEKTSFWRRTKNWLAHFLFWWTESMFNKINSCNTKFHTIIIINASKRWAKVPISGIFCHDAMITVKVTNFKIFWPKFELFEQQLIGVPRPHNLHQSLEDQVTFILVKVLVSLAEYSIFLTFSRETAHRVCGLPFWKIAKL